MNPIIIFKDGIKSGDKFVATVDSVEGRTRVKLTKLDEYPGENAMIQKDLLL